MKADKEFIEQVKGANRIEEVIGNDLGELRRSGQALVCECPFCLGGKKKFSVHPGKQVFRCWRCDAKGDVIGWVMQRQGLPFGEALELLANRGGIPLPPT